MKQTETSLGELAFQAEAGDTGAQYRIAVLFLLGEAVEQDLNAAYLWMKRAASGQHHGAQLLIESLASCRTLPKPAKNTALLPMHAERVAPVLAATTASSLRTIQSAVRWSMMRLSESLALRPGTGMPSRRHGKATDFPAYHNDGFEIPEVS
jgi:TPR repeat protein